MQHSSAGAFHCRAAGSEGKGPRPAPAMGSTRIYGTNQRNFQHVICRFRKSNGKSDAIRSITLAHRSPIQLLASPAAPSAGRRPVFFLTMRTTARRTCSVQTRPHRPVLPPSAATRPLITNFALLTEVLGLKRTVDVAHASDLRGFQRITSLTSEA